MGASTSLPLAATLERPTGAIATAIDDSLAAGSDLETDAQQLLDALASGGRAGLLRQLLATPNSASSPAESADGTPTLLNKIADILWEGARERLVAHIRAKASNTLSEEFAMSLADALAERGLAKAVLSGGAEGTSYGPASRSKRLSIALSSGHVTDALQSTARGGGRRGGGGRGRGRRAEKGGGGGGRRRRRDCGGTVSRQAAATSTFHLRPTANHRSLRRASNEPHREHRGGGGGHSRGEEASGAGSEAQTREGGGGGTREIQSEPGGTREAIWCRRVCCSAGRRWRDSRKQSEDGFGIS